MNKKIGKEWNYFILSFCVMVCAGILLVGILFVARSFATVQEPDVFHTIDGWGVEPFKGSFEMRGDVELTTSYVETDEANVSGYSRIAICFDITKGSLTSFQYRIWISPDFINWYVEATESVASGIITDAPAYYTVVLSGTDDDYFKVLPCWAKYLKLEVKGTGTVTGNTCGVEVIGVQ